MAQTKIEKLFIVNRGEICRRIGVAARSLCIPSVTLAERGQLPPQYLINVIEQFVYVEDLTTATYLDQDRIIDLAKASGANAIHPGYGFLSENAQFARKVIQADLIWIGPHEMAIAKMASKAEARLIAQMAGAPCIEALEDIDDANLEQENARLKDFGEKIGYPLLVKAAWGGGGKGMRLVNEESELLSATIRAHSEALNSFGNGQIIIEKYITQPRHIEVQVIADKHNNVYAIGDRDCSVQRRHQKIIEEAPAPGLSQVTREKMHAVACNLAKAVSYDSVGTVEFLVDWSPAYRNIQEQPFYFLEMNTRLQVEHPVTEEAFGVDLVAWQLQVAEGKHLSPNLANCSAQNHSVEVRLYAEDCENRFLPAPGRMARFEPAQLSGVRWEIGVDKHDVISPNFDPMIAKVIATASDREGALKLLCQAIDQSVVMIEKHNFGYIRSLISETEFARHPVSTRFLEKHHDKILEHQEKREAGFATFCQSILKKLSKNSIGGSYDSSNNSVSIQSVAKAAYQAIPEDRGTQVSNDCAILTMEESSHWFAQSPKINIVWGRAAELQNDKLVGFAYSRIDEIDKKTYWVCHHGVARAQVMLRPSLDAANGVDDTTSVKAPVPGKVVSVNVKADDDVTSKQVLLVIESMKMEFEVKATSDAKVKEVLVSLGDQVEAGSELISWAGEP